MPTNSARSTLTTILTEQGHGVLDQPRRVEALLSDLCPDQRRETHLLAGAQREGVPDELRAATTIPPPLLRARLQQRLAENLSVTEEAARWAVETWAVALGLLAEGEAETGPSLRDSQRRRATPPSDSPDVEAAAFVIASGADTHPLTPGAAFDWDATAGPAAASQSAAVRPAPGGTSARMLVVADPSAPSRLALENRGGSPWTALLPNGESRQVAPGERLPLSDAIRLQVCREGRIFGDAMGANGFTGGFSYETPAVWCSIHRGTPPEQPQQWPAPPPAGNASWQTPPQGSSQWQTPPQGPPPTWPPPVTGPGGWQVGMNDSGTGATAVLPPQLKGFNWGALWLGWIWAVGNSTWIGLLALIPYVGFVMSIVQGFKGNEWAWQNRRWNSVEEFQANQKVWAIVGWIWFGLFITVVILAAIGGAFNNSRTD